MVLTPFQTVGPYLTLGLRIGADSIALPEGHPRIVIHGRLVDGGGNGIPDGVLEIWQPVLALFQRAHVDETGAFAIETVKPAVSTDPAGGPQAAHLALRVLGRGILTQYLTRVYFADDPHLATDPVLSLVPAARRRTLIAATTDGHRYAFNVILQGDNETVFFDV